MTLLVKELKNQNINCQVVFLDASAETLSQRFSETRRKHPLANSNCSLEEAMVLERQLMQPIFCDANFTTQRSSGGGGWNGQLVISWPKGVQHPT